LWYNGNMDPTSLVLTTFDTAIKAYSILRRKPYVTVEVKYAPQRGRSGEVTKGLIAITIINESSPEIDIQSVWFLTSFNRVIFSELIDSKMPVKVLGRRRTTYFIPIEELKAALNKSAGETITKAVVLDKHGRKYVSRVDKATEAEFAR